MTEEADWKAIEVPEGELRMAWRQGDAHVLAFRFFSAYPGMPTDDWEIEAGVKWDGCINWETNPDCLYHFCDPGSVASLARAFDRAWAFTRDNLATADADSFAAKAPSPLGGEK